MTEVQRIFTVERAHVAVLRKFFIKMPMEIELKLGFNYFAAPINMDLLEDTISVLKKMAEERRLDDLKERLNKLPSGKDLEAKAEEVLKSLAASKTILTYKNFFKNHLKLDIDAELKAIKDTTPALRLEHEKDKKIYIGTKEKATESGEKIESKGVQDIQIVLAEEFLTQLKPMQKEPGHYLNQ